MRSNMIDVLPKLPSINPQLRTIPTDATIATQIIRRISKDETQWDVIALWQIQSEINLIQSNARLRKPKEAGRRRDPVVIWGMRGSEALPLGVEPAFVEWPAHFVDVLLAAEVAC